MLAGIYYGAQHGGSTTAILMKVPGESSSVVTCLDGYEMARQRTRGHRAWQQPRIASFFAGTVDDAAHRLLQPAADGGGAEIRPGGIFFADGARPHRRGACSRTVR